MAQTREHLAILRLAGRPQISVVLTKADRVPAERVEKSGRKSQNCCYLTAGLESPVFVTPHPIPAKGWMHCGRICVCIISSKPQTAGQKTFPDGD